MTAPGIDQQENPSEDNCPKKMIVKINNANRIIEKQFINPKYLTNHFIQ